MLFRNPKRSLTISEHIKGTLQLLQGHLDPINTPGLLEMDLLWPLWTALTYPGALPWIKAHLKDSQSQPKNFWSLQGFVGTPK